MEGKIMSIWDDYKAEEMVHLEPGDYRVAIVDAQETTSKNAGNPMIVISVQPSGSKIKIKNYIVKNEYFNKNITSLFDSFGIERGNFEFLSWIGAMGAARLEEDEKGYLKVKWFLDQKKQEKLPPWEGELPQCQEIRTDFTQVDIPVDEDLPF